MFVPFNQPQTTTKRLSTIGDNLVLIGAICAFLAMMIVF